MISNEIKLKDCWKIPEDCSFNKIRKGPQRKGPAEKKEQVKLTKPK